MSEHNGVTGAWEQTKTEDIVKGDIVRLTGTWDGWDAVSREIEPGEDDLIEKFVPAVTVPTESGLYKDVEGDLWFLSNDTEDWQLSAGGQEFNVDDYGPANYLPLTKIEL